MYVRTSSHTKERQSMKNLERERERRKREKAGRKRERGRGMCS